MCYLSGVGNYSIKKCVYYAKTNNYEIRMANAFLFILSIYDVSNIIHPVTLVSKHERESRKWF